MRLRFSEAKMTSLSMILPVTFLSDSVASRRASLILAMRSSARASALSRRAWVSSRMPSSLLVILEKKKEDILNAEKYLKKSLAKLAQSLGSSEPKIKFYPGKESLTAIFAEVLRSGAKEALFLWPYLEMTELVGEDNLRDFTNRRVIEEISVRSIYMYGTHIPLILQNEIIRHAPKGSIWDMGEIIFANKVAFISSRKEQFAFIVHSHDFVQLQKMQFESLWKASDLYKKSKKFN